MASDQPNDLAITATMTAWIDGWRSAGKRHRQVDCLDAERLLKVTSSVPMEKVEMFIVISTNTCVVSPTPGNARAIKGTP